ncbi:GNAT family N-acetyltransferase [Paenibacillus sp. HB172176]|uniref:GNAT family N-acetyltransferase n=1 Tax=Paenibacillus sp. HB172176 TaxID=2493690 RepID=UPI00143890F2|nr:GNAT family N-acetyltransferase [Paenibacillus sp. HB172176]
MSNIRLLQAGEVEEAIRLADSVFRDDEQVSMREAFPSVFSKSLKQSYGAFEEGKLVSFMGFVPSIVQIESARLHIYSIGAVCTHPDARGKGYASQLMTAVLSHANEAGAALILVSGNRSLYTRSACYPFGSVKRYSLDENHRELPLNDQQITVREWRPADLFKLTELARIRTAYYEQSVTDLAGLIHASAYASNLKMEHTVLVAEKLGECAAFAVIAVPGDKSAHRTPFVVERAGDATATATLLAQALKFNTQSKLDIAINWYESELNEAFQFIPNKPEQNSGTIHVVNVNHLNAQLRPYLEARSRNISGVDESSIPQIMQMENSEGMYKMLFPNQPAVFLDGAGLVACLFDPPANNNDYSPYFPVPFPYTVGLNYI